MSFFALISPNADAALSGSKYSPAHEEVEMLFRSSKEPTAKDAIWTQEKIFKVGVLNDGYSQDGYAQYICLILEEHGFKGKGIWVHVIDIVQLADHGKWIKLGQKRCDR